MLAAAGILVAVSFAPTLARAGSYDLGGVLPGGGLVRVTVPNMQELKFEGEVRQHEDYGCGAAALATVLKYAYGMQVTEASVLEGMMKTSNPEAVRKYGFSMLDMVRYVQSLGLRANGFRLGGIKTLTKLHVPVIVLLNIHGYEHFVVVRQATPQFVFVADPALGMRAMSTDEFDKAWENKIILLVVGHKYKNVNSLVAVKARPGAASLIRGQLPNMANVARSTLMNFSTSPWGLF